MYNQWIIYFQLTFKSQSHSFKSFYFIFKILPLGMYSRVGCYGRRTVVSIYLWYSHLSNKIESTLTNFEKFPPSQKEIQTPRLLISSLKCLILLQNLMKILLTVILAIKLCSSSKNDVLVILHFLHLLHVYSNLHVY